MPKLTMSKKSLEPPASLPPGIVTLRMDGFKPKLSRKKPGKDQSLNLNPVLTVINNPNPDVNNRKHFENLNLNATWVIRDFVHCFGVALEDAGSDDVSIPGEFIGGDPATFEGSTYQGPLLGKVGQVELIEVPATDEHGNQVAGKTRTVTKRYICSVPGCQEKHSENLAKV